MVVGVGLLAASSVCAGTLRLSYTTRGLPAGAQVWIEVEPEYHEMVAPAPSTGATLREVRPPVAAEAEGKYAWQLEVPAGGEVIPSSHDFTFPATIDWTSSDHDGEGAVGAVRAIYLKTRFRIDSLEGPLKGGYGGIHEATFGVSLPVGATEVSRCLRLRTEGGRLAAETAADCSDASFAKAHDSRMHVRLQQARSAVSGGGACGAIGQDASLANGVTPKRIGGCETALTGCGHCLCFVCFLTFADCTGFPSGPCFCDYEDCVVVNHCV
jgi:hypothetical protein